jgi:hypothetical protein
MLCRATPWFRSWRRAEFSVPRVAAADTRAGTRLSLRASRGTPEAGVSYLTNQLPDGLTFHGHAVSTFPIRPGRA